MIQAWVYDDKGFFINTILTETLTDNMTTVPFSIGYIKPKFNGTDWVEGATAEEIEAWKQENKIDICSVKQQKVQQSKKLLATWLANNPMLSEIHNPDGEYYTVTQEKQAQLTQLLMLYSISVQAGGEMQLTWNSTGGVCEEWTYEELSTLSFQIAGYVLPRVKKQQEYEVQINECTTEEEVNEIEIDYENIA